jgi:long-chain acyl-CoA synthetase
MTLDQILSSTANRLQNKVALKWEEKEYTFLDLDGITNKFARALKKLGVKKGERICIFMQNSPEFIMAHFGSLKAGAVTVPLNMMYRRHELCHMVNDCGAVAIVTSEENLPFVLETRKELKTLVHIIVVSDSPPTGCLSFYKLIDAESS